MPILNKEQLLAKVKTKLGEDTSDEAIGLVEDITDTFDDLEKRSKDTTDWKSKYEENDKQWREKYRDRFFSGKPADMDKPDEGEDDNNPPPEQLTFDSLFKEDK